MRLLESIRFGLSFGLAAAALTTLVMTAWDWVENPGGLFHGADGTSWDIVLETAISWLPPVFLYAAVACFFGHAAWSGIRHAAKRRQEAGKPRGDA